MRLWHKDLIPVLTDKQLLGQWRECCAIASNIANKGTPNHILVNKIMDYPIEHFHYYGFLVCIEIQNRGFKCDFAKFNNYFPFNEYNKYKPVLYKELFKNWHNYRYLDQCYYNLQEKFDCGGISKEDWQKISLRVTELNFKGLYNLVNSLSKKEHEDER